jgi:hypothetical protein
MQRQAFSGAALGAHWHVLTNRRIPIRQRARYYKAYVDSITKYNAGCSGLSAANLNRLEAHRRRQLRKVLGVRWPKKITNQHLYERTETAPLDGHMRHRRWMLLGHVLRMAPDSPARLVPARQ